MTERIKFLKYVNDECHGKKYDLIAQCHACWVKKSCHRIFNMLKKREKK